MWPVASLHATALVLLGGSIVPGLAAQVRPGSLPDGSAFAVTANRLMFDGTGTDWGLSALMLRYTALRRNTVAYDFGGGILVADGVGALQVEAGPAFNLSLPGATVLLRAGVTSVVASGGGVVGGYAGAGLLFRVGDGVGLRLDLARHQYAAGEGSIGAWQLGGGIALLPRIR